MPDLQDWFDEFARRLANANTLPEIAELVDELITYRPWIMGRFRERIQLCCRNAITMRRKREEFDARYLEHWCMVLKDPDLQDKDREPAFPNAVYEAITQDAALDILAPNRAHELSKEEFLTITRPRYGWVRQELAIARRPPPLGEFRTFEDASDEEDSIDHDQPPAEYYYELGALHDAYCEPHQRIDPGQSIETDDDAIPWDERLAAHHYTVGIGRAADPKWPDGPGSYRRMLRRIVNDLRDGASPEGSPGSNDPEVSHSDDFTSVDWFGTRYEFKKGLQAEAVRALWKAWEDRSHSLKQDTLKERTGSAAEPFRLRDVFRRNEKMHDAWDTMIVEASKGVFRLAPPKKT